VGHDAIDHAQDMRQAPQLLEEEEMTCELWQIGAAFILGGMAGVFVMCLMVMASRDDDWKDSQ
jgi:hypothetical protein